MTDGFDLDYGNVPQYGLPSLHIPHSLTGQRDERVREMKRRRPVFRTLQCTQGGADKTLNETRKCEGAGKICAPGAMPLNEGGRRRGQGTYIDSGARYGEIWPLFILGSILGGQMGEIAWEIEESVSSRAISFPSGASGERLVMRGRGGAKRNRGENGQRIRGKPWWWERLEVSKRKNKVLVKKKNISKKNRRKDAELRSESCIDGQSET